MILFRNVYKSANDDITPNPELLDKILATQKKNHNTYRNFYKYGSVAAAFFILVGTISVYPKIKDNINVEDTPAIIEVKTEDTQNPDIFTPTADEEISAEASTVLRTEKTAQSKPENKKEFKSSQKQQNITPKASEESPSPILAEAQDTTPVILPVENEVNTEESVSPAMARAINEPVYSPDEEKITEEEALKLADEAFASDFGEEFLNSTEIKTEISESFIITRFNENQSYTVTVHTDGSIEKQY